MNGGRGQTSKLASTWAQQMFLAGPVSLHSRARCTDILVLCNYYSVAWPGMWSCCIVGDIYASTGK